jgi:signal transduction histidine kinase
MSKKRPARHGRARSLAVSAWPLRRKVALAIAIPLLLAATLGGLRVRGDLTEAANSSSSAKQVTVLRPAVAYLTAAERAMVAAQGTSAASQADLKTALQDAKGAAEQLTSAEATADLTTEQRYQIDALLDLSRALREGGTDSLSPGTWVAQLRQLQSGVTQLITTIVNAQLDPEPRLELLAQTLGGRFSLAMQQALVATDRKGDTGSLELFAELGVEGAAIDRLASALGDSEPAIATLRTGNAQRSRTVRTGGADLGGAAAYTEYDALIGKLMKGIDQQLAASASSARRHALVNGGLTLGALVAAILLALLVSRLLLNPIRKVREGTLAVAHEKLPEAVARIRAGADPGPIVPIDVSTHEEVGQLARAVDDMHRQAVLLASGEARLRAQVGEMFVTLSRRNTSLINQQLGLIERLEKDEEDPRRLESLFRLDHLAARMRRTADSLLILADAPTHAVAQHDLTVVASLQAATAGVQEYQRVRIGSADNTRISDVAAADVVHLLTELVDNALSYSSPATQVSLSATTASDGVTIEVADAGLGIPRQALADINETLRSGGEVTTDTARRMGLFVVSRLAQRHGITAALQRNHQNGTTATVFLPSSILEMVQTGKPAAPPVVVPAVKQPAPERGHASGPAAPAALSLEDRINAARGLPRRQPGAPVDAGAATTTPVSPATAPEPPSVVAPIREVAAPAPEPAVALAPAVTAPETLSVVTPIREVAAPAPEPAVAPAPAMTAPETLSEVTPLRPSADTESDTPIFKALRSAWLNANGGEEPWRSSEVEAGWDRAERVAVSLTEAPVSAAGLPMRRPGTRLVPGGVTKQSTVTARDPEAIRARLTAHAAGVSRGRSAAAATPDQPPTEAGPA